jgi:glycosyltransferase involved in cell wall biosynthesis
MPLDVVHLRFADVGTFAAARVCRRLGIPVCFTLAADPHVVIRAAERAGSLTRERWGDVDQREHYLFRAYVIEAMLEQARGLVVFPRPHSDADLHDLLHLDETAMATGRIRSVAEGIALDTIDRAAAWSTGSPEPIAWRDLEASVRALPVARAGLPLVISVARFHRIKGLHRLLEAWAGDAELFTSFNLAIVGGNLEQPTAEEQTVLELLRDVEGRYPRARDGLLLLGHHAHDQVAELLHVTRAGVGDIVGADGVYACASDKEEFGLALLEALAVGLPVVAPKIGGPATYVDDGSTGFLVDTGSIDDLRRGLKGAAAVRQDDARAASASLLVRERFSVDAMAEQLTSLYSDVTGSRQVVGVA